MTDEADIAIIGAGAAGLTAAIFAAESAAPDHRVVLLDGAKRVGAKILVAGGGRCNVTHHQVKADDFNGPRNVVRNVLRSFTVAQTIAWFESMGVSLKREETGKLFPVSDDAHTVLNALLGRARAVGATLLTEHRVQDIKHDADGFLITHSGGELRARKLIMATGGRSLPKTGSDGGGWSIIKHLGHTVTPTYPALVPLVLDDSFFHAQVSGIAQEVELKTFAAGKLIDRRHGSLLWTHFGISGPVVMDASRFWVIANETTSDAQLRAAVLPEPFEVVEKWLITQAAAAPKRPLSALLAERLPRRVAEVLTAHVAHQDSATATEANPAIGRMTRDHRRAVVHALTDLTLPVLRDRGWNYAEVTAGGVPMTEVNHRTMASRQVAGLHLVGEMLDVEGRIGGFNFQWAWATGHAAGRAAGEAVRS
ncbi:MAG: aminoacetone oxidase family FAD-binding enzyme [Phycisphaeraceae bacterium]